MSGADQQRIKAQVYDAREQIDELDDLLRELHDALSSQAVTAVIVSPHLVEKMGEVGRMLVDFSERLGRGGIEP